MTNDKALTSYINKTKQLIQRTEGNYAQSVLADFNDALRKSPNKHKTAYQWLQDYTHGKRVNPKPQHTPDKAPLLTPKGARL